MTRNAEWPNRVTWAALGNQVQVVGDITRRVYRIALHYAGAQPENRPASDFKHPDLEPWVTAHRAELVSACLTLIRAWFAAGKPKATLPYEMGTFGQWQQLIAGILGHAGVEGFMANVVDWRFETDFDYQYWISHLTWLYGTFGSESFLCRDVKAELLRDPKESEAPPGLDDPEPKSYAKNLGEAYAKVQDRDFGGYRLVKAHRGHGNTTNWTVVPPDVPDGGSGEPFNHYYA